MDKEKLRFVNKQLKWGYQADATGYYTSVFESDFCGWIKKPKKEWPMYISTMELLNRDIRGLNHESWKRFADEIKDYNLHITAHDSFMMNDFYNPEIGESSVSIKEFFSRPILQVQGNLLNMFWYVVPESYNGRFPAFEKTIEQGIENIKFANMYGADRITIHVTKPGVMLNETEFNHYLEKWNMLYKKGKELGVKVLVETGGVTQKQMLKLKNEDAYFNLDTAHALIDKIDVLQLYNLLNENIKEIQLSMTKDEMDYHKGVDYTGKGYNPLLRKINAEIVRKVSKRQKDNDDITLILEDNPSDSDVNFLYAALRGEV